MGAWTAFAAPRAGVRRERMTRGSPAVHCCVLLAHGQLRAPPGPARVDRASVHFVVGLHTCVEFKILEYTERTHTHTRRAGARAKSKTYYVVRTSTYVVTPRTDHRAQSRPALHTRRHTDHGKLGVYIKGLKP